MHIALTEVSASIKSDKRERVRPVWLPHPGAPIPQRHPRHLQHPPHVDIAGVQAGQERGPVGQNARARSIHGALSHTIPHRYGFR